jgi:hypothetical protein
VSPKTLAEISQGLGIPVFDNTAGFRVVIANSARNGRLYYTWTFRNLF